MSVVRIGRAWGGNRGGSVGVRQGGCVDVGRDGGCSGGADVVAVIAIRDQTDTVRVRIPTEADTTVRDEVRWAKGGIVLATLRTTIATTNRNRDVVLVRRKLRYAEGMTKGVRPWMSMGTLAVSAAGRT